MADARPPLASTSLVVTGDPAEAARMRALLDADAGSDAVVVCVDGVFAGTALSRIDPERLASALREALRNAGAVTPRARHDARAKPLVLVVEDDEFSHQLMASMLVDEHLELVFEADGAAAIDRIRSLDPDLVLMDVNLPGCDGVAITQQLKAEPALAAIPVVMITGEARRDTLMRSVEAGASDFIVKPFSRDALAAKVARYLPAAA